MSAADVPLRYRRLRAPLEDGAALLDPPPAEAARLAAANQALAETWDAPSGVPLCAWRETARRALLGTVAGEEFRKAAWRRPIVLSGHQPTLFHPGVWLKSFLLDQLARQIGGIGIDLVIDNDIAGLAGIRVPTGSRFAPRLEEVPYDAPAEGIPFEERALLDREVFLSFRERVQAALGGRQPATQRLILDRLWNLAAKSLGEPSGGRLLLGQTVALARHRLEAELGLATQMELLSRVCRQSVFGQFVDHLLRRWPQLHPIYNAALAEYRTVNHIRSAVQPAPDLAADGPWLEAPFWIWTAAQPRRRRAFVRSDAGGWELTDRAGITLKPGDFDPAEETVKLRPRAFITTMYARLVLADLFIHGIGGAKYDELTDALIRRFFHIEPPAYVIATATFRLPIDRPNVTAEHVRQVERRIRDVQYHPETFVDEVTGRRGALLRALAAQKGELIVAGWQEKQKKQWHDQVTQCNEQMTTILQDVQRRLREKRAALVAELHAAELLGSREFSFCLFPLETLPRQLLDLCAARA